MRTPEGSEERVTVLVTDDDRSLLPVLRRTLLELEPDANVLAASSGAEALSILRTHPVDVLVTDQKMPGMSGLDLIAEARRILPDLQIILLTGYVDTDALLAAINEGRVFRYLVKPWQRTELLAAVREAAARAAVRRERDALLARQTRRLHTMSALVELSAHANAPHGERQLLELVQRALTGIVPFDVAALLLVPPGFGGAAPAFMVLSTSEGDASTEPKPESDRLLEARDRCLAIYDEARGAPPTDAATLGVQVLGTGLVRGARTLAARSCVIGRRATDGGDGVLGAIYVASSDPLAYTQDDQHNLAALAALTAELAGRLRARLNDERSRMELMVASMADGVVMTDAAGEIFLLNPAARRLLSLPPAEADAPPITAQFLKEKLGFYPFDLVRAGRGPTEPIREEVRVGDQYLHSIVSQVVDGAGNRIGVMVVLRDVTEQKALDSRKEEFVSVVSHELRTPLTSIGGALELLSEQYDGGLSEKQLRYVQMARDSAQKLNHIVDDLLDVARAERGGVQLRKDAIDLVALVAATVERFRGAAEHKRIALDVRGAGTLPLVADADRLVQVLSNLLSNALKFTPDGGRIEVETFGAPVIRELVGLTVWNGGPVIAEADRERVFDKFEQVQASNTRRVGGTGLGLAISRGIVERHGGQIWVEPSPSGARFVLTLPIEAREMPEGSALPPPPQQGLQKSVLVVHADRASTWLLKGALLGHRHRVHAAHDAESALALARERRPDLVAIDLPAVGSAGAALVEILRHDPETRKIPIVVLAESTDRATVIPSDAMLILPISLARLRETVISQLADASNLRRRVLIVDDDAAIRLICREVLEAHGFLVREAEEGNGAIAEARRFRPDLVLVDVMMPEIDGFELAQRLRGERETALVPIIFVSARGQTADKVRAFKLGAEDYLVKPFDTAELVARVEKALLRRDFDLGASPTTRLPGSQVIAQEIDRRLRDGGRFAFCYLDLDNLKAFNDYYGYAKADAVILQTGDIVREAVARHGGPGDFIGHIAGDDFVLITSVERADEVCGGVIDTFDRLVPLYYNKSDRERGFIEARDRFGELRKFPVMSISIACITGAGRGVRTHAELSTQAASLKQAAKAIVGSAYVRDGQVRIPASVAG
jgi:PAS domain S-box-containing protein